MLNPIKKWRTARDERRKARWKAKVRSVCDSWLEDFKRMREKENE